MTSGKEADYYVDLRRATLQHEASRLIGSLHAVLLGFLAHDEGIDVATISVHHGGSNRVCASLYSLAGAPVRAVKYFSYSFCTRVMT